MKLRLKLWILFLASTVTSFFVLFGFAAVIGLFFNQGYTHESMTELGEVIVSDLENNASSEDDAKALINNYAEDYPDIHMIWFTYDGRLIYDTKNGSTSLTFEEYMDHFLNMPQNLWLYDEHAAFLFDFEIDETRYYLLASLQGDAVQGSQIFIYIADYQQLAMLVLPIILFLVTPIIFAYVFFSRINHRLNRLNNVMKKFKFSGEKHLIEDDSKDEISQLTHNFNDMAQRIQKQVEEIQVIDEKRQSLIANLSHDLRTPLTMIIGYAETLNSEMQIDQITRKKHLEIILRRSTYMNNLLEKLLEVAQLDQYKTRIKKKEQNIIELIRRIAADYFLDFEADGIDFVVDLPDKPIIANFDKELLERALQNLIDNAYKYGADGKYIRLQIVQKEKMIQINVTDHGKGIPQSKQKHIKERFYRGEEGRSGEGLGIGLSIVEEVVNAHDGKLILKSIPNKETTFSVILPLAN